MRPAVLLVLFPILMTAQAARGDDEPAAKEEPPQSAASSNLPELPPLERRAPKQSATQMVDARLEQLVSLKANDPIEPKVDFAFLTADLDDDAVPAIAQKLEEIRRSVSGSRAKAVLERARKHGSKELSKRARRDKSGRRTTDDLDAEGDWLQFVLSVESREDAAYVDLVRIYGMLRMLEAVGTTSAVREMIAAFGYFGELVRIDLQRALGRLSDKAVPALIEAREHDAKKVRTWARKLLDSMGRAIPGEAVATTDPNVLADVLVAFGRVRDLDATRVLLSFVASDRSQLRRAARQGLVALGEAATWQLRDAYESATGKKPPRAWDHKRLAAELFRLHDRARMASVYELMDRGLDLARSGEVAGAVSAFDRVLARTPLFERRAEMAPSYVLRASELEKDARFEEALVSLRKARRLAPEAEDRSRVESRIAYLEGRQLVERGTPDPVILKRAIELDPDNRDARALLMSVEERTVRIEQVGKRYALAAMIGAAGVAAMVWLARRRGPLLDETKVSRSERDEPLDGPSRGGTLTNDAALGKSRARGIDPTDTESPAPTKSDPAQSVDNMNEADGPSSSDSAPSA